MQKRITLLRKRPDITSEEFRRHWSIPHARIATGFTGLAHYFQNRVTSEIWTHGSTPFQVDGIVELWFTSPEAVRQNAASDTTKALIEDEPRFLCGLTALAAGETDLAPGSDQAGKYMVLAQSDAPERLRDTLRAALGNVPHHIDIVTPAFVRDALRAEPLPPNLVLSLWLTESHEVLARVRDVFNATETACAYQIDALRIV